MNSSKRYNHITDKDNAETAKDIMTTSGQIQPLKIPDAVVALAQAAAKANGETEKCMSCQKQIFQDGHCFRLLSCNWTSAPSVRENSALQSTLDGIHDFPKNRDHIAAFWDKLTVDEAKTILSSLDVAIEGVAGSSILTALTAWMCKPGYASLPVAYARAGSELLDLIQTKASLQLHVSSNELFSVLDEASENTFLCTNTTAYIQKFLFEGEADKVATELKNVVACASYMLEKKLVEAWSADKAAEALRCQKLLVEEEEAAQKRQAELMERKRMKKLRQKEQKSKDLKNEEVSVHLSEIVIVASGSPELQSLKAVSDPGLYEQEDSQHPQFQAQDDYGFNVDRVEGTSCDSGHEMDAGVTTRQQFISKHHMGRTENLAQNSFSSGTALASKHPARHSSYRDPNVYTLSNRNKTWERKVRADIEEQCPKHDLDIDVGLGKNSRVLIGSISVAIEDGSEHSQEFGNPKHDSASPSSKIINNSVTEVMESLRHEESRKNDNTTTCCNADLAGSGGYRFVQGKKEDCRRNHLAAPFFGSSSGEKNTQELDSPFVCGKMLASLLFGRKGSSGFSWSSTADEVTAGVSAAGLTAIVTGASSGIGAETARTLALRGAHVVMAVRSLPAAQELRDAVLAQAPEAKLDVMELDLSSMASVRAFASEFISRGLPLNILMCLRYLQMADVTSLFPCNNAGVMAIPFALSKDGIEMQFATNHVGHFLLTHLLLDTMKNTSHESNVEGRIVNVSSEGHRFAYKEGIRFEKINDESVYSSIGAYGQSKLANILHANELTRRFKEEGVNITANSLHPGSIITNLLRHHSILDVIHRTLGKLVLKNAQQGAATTCYVALHPQVKGVSGKYFCDSNVYEPSEKAKDAGLAKRLWDFSIELIT
ncbi:hypothetical protein EJB05_44129 [Eragrostis curvula]|uniref:Short-chain dehydrogenase TIC 32, chloroplastic n=1 Tax=Eragrostis curvula TaxID=38414 RepID=A0A5J9TH72_9POAL|nr:hypothetical protein EJB05_44129 [Eragrostis curvula]